MNMNNYCHCDTAILCPDGRIRCSVTFDLATDTCTDIVPGSPKLWKPELVTQLLKPKKRKTKVK